MEATIGGGLDSRDARQAAKQAVLAGMEAHICVVQTAASLIEEGYEVFVVSDPIHRRLTADANTESGVIPMTLTRGRTMAAIAAVSDESPDEPSSALLEGSALERGTTADFNDCISSSTVAAWVFCDLPSSSRPKRPSLSARSFKARFC